MKELMEEIRAAATKEYDRAAEKYGTVNNSSHESYAVILEEYDEAESSARAFKIEQGIFWLAVKQNRGTKPILESMHYHALKVAAEWVQVAAMCHKAQKSIGDENA
jgi:DNA-binding ferritin-like protein